MSEDEEPVESKVKKQKYPCAVFFIIGSEFCERFSFYGMRTILTIYATKVLLYDNDSATVLFHSFIVACYFTPIFGAIVADSYWGKFRTIFYISVVYCIGCIVVSVGAIPAALHQMRVTSVIGLLLIAIGTGGIKPCVSAFGGDQFEPGQEKYQQQFFSIFYMSINLGSVLSTFITPLLRSDVYCFGQQSCFSLAFGVPAFLMVIALIIFLLGKPLYKMVPPHKGNIIVQVVKCVVHALVRKCQQCRKGTQKPHWLDYAQDKYDSNFLQDVKVLLHVLFLYLPLPMFWALFDQLGSRWTIQATKLDGDISEKYQMKPDQMQIINPLLVIILIPLFEYFVYPLLKKCHFLTRPLQRITTGGILAASAFVVAGFLEFGIQGNMPDPIKPGFAEVMVINNSPCEMNLNGSFEGLLPPFESHLVSHVARGEKHNWTFIPRSCPGVSEPMTSILLSKTNFESMMVTVDSGKVKAMIVEELKEKSKTGNSLVRIFYRLNRIFYQNSTATFQLKSSKDSYFISPNTNKKASVGITEYKEMIPSKYFIYLPADLSTHEKEPVGNISIGWGGRYVVSIFQEEQNSSAVTLKVFKTVEPNTISMLYQIPQYVLITTGELMFSVTGLEFSYSQAPISMKSVLQASWLLNVAVGDCVVVAVAEARMFANQAYEFFMFAGLMALDMFVFAIFAYFYKYTNIHDYDDESADP